RPWVGLVVPAAVLVLAASPIFGMHIGTSGVSVLPQSSESRQGYTALRHDFPGSTAEPATIVVASGASNAATERALEHLRTTLASEPRFGPGTIQRSANGTAAVLSVPVTGDAAGTRAVAAVRPLPPA